MRPSKTGHTVERGSDSHIQLDSGPARLRAALHVPVRSIVLLLLYLPGTSLVLY